MGITPDATPLGDAVKTRLVTLFLTTSALLALAVPAFAGTSLMS